MRCYNFERSELSGVFIGTDFLYLDFKKAFDSVLHNELLVKLWSFGITGSLWHWFKAYLTSRNQLVSVNHCYILRYLACSFWGATRQYFGSFSIPGLCI